MKNLLKSERFMISAAYDDSKGVMCRTGREPLKILLVEDNEADYVLIREMLRAFYSSERARNRDGVIQSELDLRKLSTRLLTVQETERKNLARDLHDSIGQSLTAMKSGVEQTLTETGDCLERVSTDRLRAVWEAA